MLSKYAGIPSASQRVEHRVHRGGSQTFALAGRVGAESLEIEMQFGRPDGRASCPRRLDNRSLASPTQVEHRHHRLGGGPVELERAGRDPERRARERLRPCTTRRRGTLEYRLSNSKTCSRIDRRVRRIAERPDLQRVVEKRSCRSRRDHRAILDRHLANAVRPARENPAPCKYGGVTGDIPDAPDGELRFDALTGEWVNIVGHRQARPNLPSEGCPFCVGGLEAPDPYDVRWFTNRWPALAPGAPPDLRIDALDATNATRPAVGACEVVLFSPEHDQSLAGLPPEQVRKVVDLWAARTEALLARPEIEYVLVFENRGREVGATIDHPHGQIYGYPFVPPAPATEAQHPDGCLVCRELDSESRRRRSASSPRPATGSRGCRSRRATRTACESRPAPTSGRCPRSTPRRVTISHES